MAAKPAQPFQHWRTAAGASTRVSGEKGQKKNNQAQEHTPQSTVEAGNSESAPLCCSGWPITMSGPAVACPGPLCEYLNHTVSPKGPLAACSMQSRGTLTSSCLRHPPPLGHGVPRTALLPSHLPRASADLRCQGGLVWEQDAGRPEEERSASVCIIQDRPGPLCEYPYRDMDMHELSGM